MMRRPSCANGCAYPSVTMKTPPITALAANDRIRFTSTPCCALALQRLVPALIVQRAQQRGNLAAELARVRRELMIVIRSLIPPRRDHRGIGRSRPLIHDV